MTDFFACPDCGYPEMYCECDCRYCGDPVDVCTCATMCEVCHQPLRHCDCAYLYKEPHEAI